MFNIYKVNAPMQSKCKLFKALTRRQGIHFIYSIIGLFNFSILQNDVYAAAFWRTGSYAPVRVSVALRLVKVYHPAYPVSE